MKKSLGAKTILYPTPVLIVGTYGVQGRPNIMNAAWGGICCSEPPCVTISIRPGRKTYENIMATGAYTLNIPSVDQVKSADYCGLVSGHQEDKFARMGLTALKSDKVNAPLIAEYPLALECRLYKTVDLGIHTQFIGEIMDVKVEESVLDEAGNISMEKLQPFLFAPETGNYYRFGEVLAQAFSVGKLD